MAELLLKVGNQGTYEDGDVLCAFNDLHIQRCHAEVICNIKHQGFNADGLREPGIVTEDYLQNIMQYKFERISPTEVKRTDLTDQTFEIFNNTPNEKGERLDAQSYITRRKRHERHLIFGTEGSEYWFGGHSRLEQANVDAVWTAIEAKTANLKANHKDWPLTPYELSLFLVVPTADFLETKITELTESEYDNTDPDNPVMIKKRKRKIDYANDLEISAETLAKIQDPRQQVPKPKSKTYSVDTVVKVKS